MSAVVAAWYEAVPAAFPLSSRRCAGGPTHRRTRPTQMHINCTHIFIFKLNSKVFQFLVLNFLAGWPGHHSQTVNFWRVSKPRCWESSIDVWKPKQPVRKFCAAVHFLWNLLETLRTWRKSGFSMSTSSLATGDRVRHWRQGSGPLARAVFAIFFGFFSFSTARLFCPDLNV